MPSPPVPFHTTPENTSPRPPLLAQNVPLYTYVASFTSIASYTTYLVLYYFLDLPLRSPYARPPRPPPRPLLHLRRRDLLPLRHRPLLPPLAPLHLEVNYPFGISAAPPLVRRERVSVPGSQPLVEADYLSEVLDALVPPAALPSLAAIRK